MQFDQGSQPSIIIFFFNHDNIEYTFKTSYMHKFVAIGKNSHICNRHAAALRKKAMSTGYEMEDNTASEELILSWF